MKYNYVKISDNNLLNKKLTHIAATFGCRSRVNIRASSSSACSAARCAAAEEVAFAFAGSSLDANSSSTGVSRHCATCARRPPTRSAKVVVVVVVVVVVDVDVVVVA